MGKNPAERQMAFDAAFVVLGNAGMSPQRIRAGQVENLADGFARQVLPWDSGRTIQPISEMPSWEYSVTVPATCAELPATTILIQVLSSRTA
ncbi:hypothetical protein [Micromonospora lutea]|uniref:Uncharacterized protein n=1 Tax=Micromonospora lutea TaxID=419825 RepID=A0ABQ4J140_9ACTN|nr:hypothetical protein [Micromonospora lutea]GIJ23923.1 hypothetical protein Vlu01_45470 [Micromonospora lutea]